MPFTRRLSTMRAAILLAAAFAATSVCAQPNPWVPFESPTPEFLAEGDLYLSANVVGGLAASGVLISDEGGDTWSTVTDGLPTSGDVKPVYIRGVTAFVTDLDTGRLFRSDDGGAMWTDATNGLTSPRADDGGTGRYLADLVRVEAEGGSLVALTSFEAFRLGPAGWVSSSTGLPPYSEGVVRLFIFDAAVQGRTVVVASTLGLYRSADGGETREDANQGFTSGGLPLEARAVHAAGGRFYALADYPDAFGGVYRSDDGGRTWSRRSAGLEMQGDGGGVRGARDIASAGGALYLATAGGAGVYRSSNGETWSPFGGGLPENPDGETAVASVWSASATGPLFALADAGNSQVILRAQDLPTWTGERPSAHSPRLRLVGPNPSRGGRVDVEVWVSAQASVRFEVYDVLGRRVTDVSARSVLPGGDIQTISLPTLAPGVYTVRAIGVSQPSVRPRAVRFTVTY